MKRFLVAALTWACGAYPALSQGAATDPVAARPDIVEVLVSSADEGQVQDGGGWAFADTSSEARPCRVVTPWHVVRGQFGPNPAQEIYVRVAGADAEYAAVLIDTLLFEDHDLAVLRIGRNRPCPFDIDLARAPLDAGLFLWRVSPRTFEHDIPQHLDPATPITQSGAGPFLAARMAPGAAISQSWSGSTVIRDGVRIGMAVSIDAAGDDAAAGVNFIGAATMQRLFGTSLDILDGPAGGSALAARQELGQMGYVFSADGLADALLVGDARALRLFRQAEIGIDALGTALALPAGGDTVASAFFEVAIGKPPLVAWLRSEILRGLDPNLRVPGDHYEDEALLGKALLSGNLDIMRVLLESGAAPHPPQSLDGTHYARTRFMHPLLMLPHLETLTDADKRAAVRLFLDHGMVLPDAAYRRPDGTLDPYTPRDRGKRPVAFFEEDVMGYGIDVRPTPDLCESPRPAMCESASRLYGFDWCGFVEDLPKGFVGGPAGGAPLPVLALVHLLAIERNRAHFLAFGQTYADPYIVSVAPDMKAVELGVHTSNYGCQPRDDGSTQRLCWNVRRLRAPGGGENGSGNASYGFRDTCALIDDAGETLSGDPYAWTDDVLGDAVQLNKLTAGLLRVRSGVDADVVWQKLVGDLASDEQAIDGNLEYSASRRPGLTPVRLGPEFLSDPAHLAWITDTLTGAPTRTTELGLADSTLNFIRLTDPGRNPSTAADLALTRIADIVMPAMPERIYVVTKLADLAMSGEGLTARPGSTARESLLALAAPLGGTLYRDLLEALGGAARERVFFRFNAVGHETLHTQRVFSATTFDPLAAHWSPHLHGATAFFTFLALDREVRFDALPVAPDVAVELLAKARERRHEFDSWRLLTILKNPRPRRVPPPANEFYMLSADVDRVVLVAPSGEAAAIYPAETFPLYRDQNSLVSDGPAPEAAFPDPLPLTTQSRDFILARHAPGQLTDTVLLTLAKQRWIYERAVEAPLGGRFFVATADRPEEAELAAILPDYLAFLKARAAAVPETILAETSGPDGGANWRFGKSRPEAPCLWSLDATGRPATTGKTAAYIATLFRGRNCAPAEIDQALREAAAGLPRHFSRLSPPIALAFAVPSGTVDGTSPEGAAFLVRVSGDAIAAVPGMGQVTGGAPVVVLPVTLTEAD